MTKGDRVMLTLSARDRFPEIGTRAGTVIGAGAWVMVRWDGSDDVVHLPVEDLQRIEA